MHSFCCTFLLLFALLPVSAAAQIVDNPYQAHFEEAYQQHPSLPRGLLEAVAFANTRLRHLKPVESCQGLPLYVGVMGLVEDGKGYFQNSLDKVARLSGYAPQQIKADPRTCILAYAKAYAALQSNKRLDSRGVEAHEPILAELTEIPQDQSVQNQFALDQQFYGILKEMQEPHTNAGLRTRKVFNFEEIFGRDRYRILSADYVEVSRTKVRTLNGDLYRAPGARTADCTAGRNAANYAGAIWNPAHPENYGSRNGETVKYITIHTIQGSYASAIAWFRNRRARVSAHYIIRASDGQVTQMVCEEDKAYHVRDDNANAIGLEHEGFIDDGGAWYTNEMYQSSAALVRDICKRYGIDPLKTFGGPPTSGTRTLTNTCYHVKGHQHFPNNTHIDPGPYWDWDRYYRLINPEPAPKVFADRRGTVYDDGGKNGNYGDQKRLTYLIQPAEATLIKAGFKSFDLEGTKDKPYDYVDIYDGADINGRLIGRFTGDHLPPDFEARSGSIFMEFRSDCQVNKKGWELEYVAKSRTPDCPPPTNLVASDIYPMGATLTWEAVPGADRYVLDVRRKLEDKWTRFVTPLNEVTVTGLSANGLYQWQVTGLCGDDSSAVAGQSFVTPNISRGERPQVYTLRLNQGRFHDSGGSFSGYGDDENYVFRIIPPDGGKVEMQFTGFDTEADHDKLMIFDGLNLNGTLLAELSGRQDPGVIRSTGNGLTLFFRSDGRTNGPGWLATWRSVEGTAPTPDPRPGPDPRPDPTPRPNPEPVTPVTGDFKPGLEFGPRSPETQPQLAGNYESSFTLSFEDTDRSGRGLANRFYNLAQENPAGLYSQGGAGFFYDNFDRGLATVWTPVTGNWQARNGQVVQTNASLANSNLYASVKQTNQTSYLYHWQARMTGESDNRRHGMHFFVSDPTKPDRGTSYFVWIRDSKSGDFLEIYKTVNDQFDRKVRERIDIETGEVYDYKVIYNPEKGRIEAYVNNDFVAAWVDRYPLFRGEAISLRTGNSVTEYDNVTVYQTREQTVRVPVGSNAEAPLGGEGRFVVRSLVVDRNIRWSPVGQASSVVGPAGPVRPPAEPDPRPEPPREDESGSSTEWQASYADDFSLRFDVPAGVQGFFLPAVADRGRWQANSNLGFLIDEFEGSRLSSDWSAVAGNWTANGGALRQTDENSGNTNLFMPLRQDGDGVYLYHWRAKLAGPGNNKRFGLHFFASDGRQENRGDSYFVWFRNHDTRPDKVEIYRTDNNAFATYQASELIDFRPDRWYDFKVLYAPQTGQVEVWLDNKSVMEWTDTRSSHRSGQAISLRTGNAEVWFDDLRVYQLHPTGPVNISVGTQASDMLRGSRTDARLYHLQLGVDGSWLEDRTLETRIE